MSSCCFLCCLHSCIFSFFIAVQSEGSLGTHGGRTDQEEFDAEETEDVCCAQDAENSKGVRPLFIASVDTADEIEVSSSIGNGLLCSCVSTEMHAIQHLEKNDNRRRSEPRLGHGDLRIDHAMVGVAVCFFADVLDVLVGSRGFSHVSHVSFVFVYIFLLLINHNK